MKVRTILVYCLLLSLIVLTSNKFLQGVIANTLIVISYGTLMSYLIVHDDFEFRLTKKQYALVLVATIYMIWMFHYLRVMTGHLQPWETSISGRGSIMITRVPVYIAVSFLNLFIIPQYIRSPTFFGALSRLGAVVVLLGIPSLVIGSYEIVGFVFDPYTVIWPLNKFGIEIPAMTSYFADSNALSKLAFFAVFASVYEYSNTQSDKSKVLFAINFFGLLIGNSRGTLLAGGVGVILYLAYLVGDRQFMAVVVLSLATAGTVWILMVVQLLPSVGWLTDIRLTGRAASWKAALQASQNHPLLGSGVGHLPEMINPHFTDPFWRRSSLTIQSGYFRTLAISGIIGLTAYIVLIGHAVLSGIDSIESGPRAVLVIFFISILVLQIFEGFTILEANKNAAVAGLTFGYLLRDDDM